MLIAQVLGFGYEFLTFYAPIFFKFGDHFLLFKLAFDALEYLFDVCDLIFNFYSALGHIRGQNLVDKQLFVNERCKIVSFSNFIYQLADLEYLFFQRLNELKKYLNANLLHSHIFYDLFSVLPDAAIISDGIETALNFIKCLIVCLLCEFYLKWGIIL